LLVYYLDWLIDRDAFFSKDSGCVEGIEGGRFRREKGCRKGGEGDMHQSMGI
jgi:hypothetical protein